MRPLFDDFDEFDFDDSRTVARLLREQRREDARFARRRLLGPKHQKQFDDDEDYGQSENYSENTSHRDYDAYDGYDGYDEQEFDLYAGIGRQH